MLAFHLVLPPLWAAFVDGYTAIVLAHAQARAIEKSATLIAAARADVIRLGTRKASRGS